MAPGFIYTVLGISVPFVLLTFWAIFDAASRDFGTIEKKGRLGARLGGPVHRVYHLLDFRPEAGQETKSGIDL